MIETVASPSLGSTTEVADAGTVSSIYLRVEALTTADFTLQPAFYMIVFKDIANDLADPNPAGTGISESKRWIIHQEMVMLSQGESSSGEGAGFPRTIFNGVIKLPIRYKRFGFGDKLKVLMALLAGETTGVAQVCVQCIYKEFR